MIIYYFAQSLALFLPRSLLYYVNVCGGWARLRAHLWDGAEGRRDVRQDESGGISWRTGGRQTAGLVWASAGVDASPG